MIKSQYGNELTIETALYDDATEEYFGCIARRHVDQELRTYLLHQLRADGGWNEIKTALEAATKQRGGRTHAKNV